jgi:hypothetical protein
MEGAMIRHLHYLEVPWDMHWQREAAGRHPTLWWLVAMLVLVALFLIGVEGTSGLIDLIKS